ncbi:bacterio-opsin activator domain-containing protein [Natronoarchaeum mannanilyticum]|uniref:Response regulatory domain-containing protein n=1 Tax=Natronoarchaeum mannanilyticum TaxID=926360 RepID=A0AAV3T7F9_9EURY
MDTVTVQSVTDGERPRVLLVGPAEHVESTADELRGAQPAFAVTTATSGERARSIVGERDVDCVVCAEALPDTDGVSVLYAIRDSHPSIPVFLYASEGSEELASEAISAGVTDYVPVSLGEEQPAVLANRVINGVEKHRTETALERQRERLAAINRLHRVLEDVAVSVIETPTREEMERRVCERLVESDSYAFAWIGDVDRGTRAITPSASAGGEEGYLEDVTITADESDTGKGPAGTAVRTSEPQIVGDIATAESFEPWRETTLERGFRSAASIPITHRGSVYGVLTVYSERTNAFGGRESEILDALGDVLGHAFNAVQRKKTLMGDVLTELEFRIPELESPLVAATEERDCSIRVDRTLPAGEDEYVQYLTVEGIPPDAVRDLAAQVDSVERVSHLGAEETETEHQFEVAQSDPPLTSTVAAFGGRVRSGTVRDGEFRATVELPPDADVRSILEAVRERYADAELVAQRTTEQDAVTTGEFRSRVFEELTEKQRTALEAAYFSGFFEWPRENSGEEIAETLGVAPATFSQHIRNAERKIGDVLLDEARDDEAPEGAGDD